jgi:septal ring factor EnvC (AmiA/AmiB activator)
VIRKDQIHLAEIQRLDKLVAELRAEHARLKQEIEALSLQLAEEGAGWRAARDIEYERRVDAEQQLGEIADASNGYWNGGPIAETDEAAHARAKAALRTIANALGEPF